VRAADEDVMENKKMLDRPHVGSQHVVTDEESTLHHQNAALREDNEDLRASALWWKALYEEAQRRCADMESSPRVRVSSLMEVRFPRMRPSNPTRAARPDTTTRPL
jgi:hypothetical protein